MDVMWWLHTKFTIAVVLITLVLVLTLPLSKITKRYNPVTFKELKDSYASLRDDVYFR
jgi:hypothetical protein